MPTVFQAVTDPTPSLPPGSAPAAPTPSNPQATLSNPHLTPSYQRPTLSDQRPALSDQRPALSDQRPALSDHVATLRDRARPFNLEAHDGLRFDLLSPPLSRSPGHPLLVIFFRGHWCPYCRRYLSKLRDHFDRIGPLTSHVVAISPDPVDTARRLASELALPFRLLADPTGETIIAYGVRNSFSSTKTLLPHPAAFILSAPSHASASTSEAATPDAPSSVVLFKSIDRNYKKRTTIRTLITELLVHQPRG